VAIHHSSIFICAYFHARGIHCEPAFAKQGPRQLAIDAAIVLLRASTVDDPLRAKGFFAGIPPAALIGKNGPGEMGCGEQKACP
jgi:hypothetical protein